MTYGFEHGLDASAKRRDRRIGGAAASITLPQRVALLLGKQPLGDVGMRRHPAAIRKRLAHNRDDAAVPELGRLGFSAALDGLP